MTTAEWPREKIGTALRVRYGKALPKSERDELGEFPVIGSSGRMTGTASPLIDVPAVIIGRKGNAGQVQLELAGCWPIDTTYYAAVPDRIDARFLRWQLHALNLGDLDSSTATPSLRREDLEAQELVLPALDEQRRIVAILEDHLSRLDAAETYLRTAARRSAILSDQLLTTALESIPHHEKQFRELLSTGLSNGRSVPTADVGFPVLRLTALRDRRIDIAARKVGAWTAADAERFLVSKGDFLISRGNGSLHLVGRGGLVEVEPDRVAYPDTLIRARPIPEVLDTTYLSLVWNSPTVRRQIERIARTTAGIYKVNQKDLGSIRVPVPSLEDQRRIASSVVAGRTEVSRTRDAIALARLRVATLRRSLLAAAFSGRLTGPSTEMSEVAEMIDA